MSTGWETAVTPHAIGYVHEGRITRNYDRYTNVCSGEKRAGTSWRADLLLVLFSGGVPDDDETGNEMRRDSYLLLEDGLSR